MSHNKNTRHTIYTGSDIPAIGGIKFGTTTTKSASGSSHVHVTILPGNKELKSVDISTIFDIKLNPMKYAALVEDLYRRKKMTEEEYQKYGRRQEMDKKETFSASPWFVLPGQPDNFAMKIKIGDSTEEGVKYTKALHAIAFTDAVMALYDAALEILDADVNLRKDLLLKSGVAANLVNQKASEPASNWFVPPIVHTYHDKDVVVNGEQKSIGDLVVNQPGAFSLKPITVPLTADNADKKLNDGAFYYDSNGRQPGDPNYKPDMIWFTRTEYYNENDKQVSARCIEEVIPLMYVSDESRKKGDKGVKLNIPAQPIFEQEILFTCQLPTLYVNNGKAHFIFKTFNTSHIGKKVVQKSHADPALTAKKEALARAFRLSANADNQENKNDFDNVEFPSVPTLSDHTVDFDAYQESFSGGPIVELDPAGTTEHEEVVSAGTSKRPSFPTVSVVAYPKKTPSTSSEGSGEKQRGTKRKEVPQSSDDGGEEKTQTHGSASKKFKK